MLCREVVRMWYDHAGMKAGQTVCLWHMLFLIPSLTTIPEQLLVCHVWVLWYCHCGTLHALCPLED